MNPRPPVIAHIEGCAGTLTLDRPQALNALNLEMIEAMLAALDAFEGDARVRRVVLDSADPRAFCAGGDIRAVASLAAQMRVAEAAAFLGREYALDMRLADLACPSVALIDGYAMGGGLGISVHGRYRVVTERAVLSMPETIIGFFPDVGASFFLSRLPAEVGTWLGLTGARIGGADAAFLGLATHFVTSSRLPALRDALLHDGRDTAAVLAPFAETPHGFRVAALMPRIAQCFAGDDVEAIIDRVTHTSGDWARETEAQLRAASPSSLALTLQLLRAGASSTRNACFARELEAARQRLRHPDLVEGVRAALVDKDRAPRWTPHPSSP